MAAISTYQTYLMHKASSASDYTKLVDVSSFPDLFGEPNLIETTTLSDSMQTYINGIKTSELKTFESFYDRTKYTALTALEGSEEDYAIWFGAGSNGSPDGANGKFKFKGILSVAIAGGGVNEAVKMNIHITPTTVITDVTAG